MQEAVTKRCMTRRGALAAIVVALAACQTDGGPGPVTSSAQHGGIECGGPMATSRAVEHADPLIKFPTEPTEFCYPPRSRVVLYKPANVAAERLPAVVVLPTCAKMDRYHYEWMRALTQEGYLVLGLDHYTPRGVTNNCYPYARISEMTITRDAVAAYLHLKSLPIVDPERVAVIGFSLGGLTAIQAVSDSPPPTLMFGERAHFKAAAAFYPPLSLGRGKPSRLPWRLGAPVLVLYGTGDNESPHTPDYVQQLADRGSPIELIQYDGAGHLFDDTSLHTPRRRSWAGEFVIDAYDASAAARSRADTLAFLAKHLK